ncbi:MAG TPA: VTT domain-containing protein [Burkholderiaceae bacterium]|nr:VTT domain-containing protein [Burkholderiaceae bacterium]
MFEFSASTGLLGLALSSFVSATLLPGTSELVLLAVLQQHPEHHWNAIAIATIGNTLGAMTSYAIGRLLPIRVDARSIERVRRHGYPVLLFAWLPIVGDAFPLAAGWLRFGPWRSAALLALGKLARYLVLAGAWGWIASA